MLLTADFETTTYLDENEAVRVWAYGLCEIGNVSNFMYGNTIEEFLSWCSNGDNNVLYFHNLKFDGEFIISALLNMEFRHVIERHQIESKTFTTLISDKNQFYSITIYFEVKGKHTKKVTIYDSLKIIPFPVKKVAKSFKLPMRKGEIDYDKIRPIGYEADAEEIEYLKNDVTIMALALETLFNEELDQMTQGSNALHDYKNIVTKKKFDKWYPPPLYDSEIRESYKGGFTYCNPLYQNKIIGEGIVLDVNSLYPSVMYYEQLPYGEGKSFEGKYKEDKLYNLYVQMFSCQFELKKDHIPTIQMKNNLSFMPTQYVTSSVGQDGNEEERELCLTSVDLKLFFEHYDVYNIEYHGGWKFKSTTGLFTAYIDKWSSRKIQAKLEDNAGMYVLAKLMLNALYGKFALNPRVCSKIPYLDTDGIVKYRLGIEEMREPIYIPIGTFITAYARYKTITSAQKVYDRFMYADTDSLHLLGKELPADLEIDDTKLGAWKHEFTFDRAKYLRQKSYMESGIEKVKCRILKGNKKLFHHQRVTKVTCAGMSDRCYKYVDFDNFDFETEYAGNMKQRHVKGGIMLVNTMFKIRR